MSETPTIHALDDATVRRIAAGEVVERPASVVKELVENSLDADASRITVAVDGGGTDGIRVRDDGVGMTDADLERAVEEHTTSKITDSDDLDGGVGTLGFRGEALHTIGAVSRLTIRSRPRDGGRGHELTVDGGDAGDVTPSGCPPGTAVEVEDLFYNTPARKKFLKTEATEFDHVNRVVTQYALANPDVAMALEHDGREVFATEGSGDLESTVLAVYGREVASSMVAVEGDPTDAPVASVSGLVSHPETTRAGREYLSTFVNGRYVTAGTLREAVLDAYGGQLAPDRYPFAVLFIEVPPDTVDVNVHPRKMEVRYNKPEAVKHQVRSAVEDALREEGILRSSAPRGRSAPEETPIDPTSSIEEVTTADVDVNSTEADESALDEPSTAGPDDVEESPNDTGSSRSTPSTQSPQSELASSSEEAPDTSSDSSAGTTTQSSESTARESKAPESTRPSTLSDSYRTPSTEKSETDTQTSLTGGDASQPTEYDNFPNLRVLGQLHDTYVVTESDDGLILVDQHAADERVNYERLRKQFDGDTTTQVLAEPVEIELTAREAAVFDAYRDAVAQLGFHADLVDDRTVRVTTVPAIVAESVGPTLIRDVLTNFVDDERTAEETVDAVADDLLADMACHPSITGNTSLTEGSVFDLLSALDDCENPWSCPHGRPVLIQIDSEEIDDRFERDYPGHQ
ncbi:DNA mismatch repair endonuclease MutL [Haloplanus halobius]|uniref:DNA mismatch repair endonuclease MutL n=1 Tax=Haloplanus halobius TaxID=2934938 RepID=UPI00200CB876